MIEAASQMYTRPEVPFTAKRWDLDGKTVLEIDIEPCRERPYLAPDKEGHFKAYIRVADENILANDVLVLSWKKQSQTDGTLLKVSRPVELLFDYLQTHEWISDRQFCRLAHLPHYVARNILSDLLAMDTLRYVVVDKRIVYTKFS